MYKFIKDVFSNILDFNVVFKLRRSKYFEFRFKINIKRLNSIYFKFISFNNKYMSQCTNL